MENLLPHVTKVNHGRFYEDITKNDIKVLFNDKNYTNFTVTKDANGETVLNFADDITYSADTGDSNTSSILGVSIKAGSKNTGVTTHPEYDYSLLGETWSDPEFLEFQTMVQVTMIF